MAEQVDATIMELEQSAAEAAQLLRAMSNERRLLIMCQIADRELSVGQIQDLIGIGQSALSQHLAVLRDLGLVETRREAQTIYYHLASPAALAIINTLVGIYCPPGAPKK